MNTNYKISTMGKVTWAFES